MLKHSCLRLPRAYILLFNVTDITSKHQKSVNQKIDDILNNIAHIWTLSDALVHWIHLHQSSLTQILDFLVSLNPWYVQTTVTVSWFLKKTRVSRIFYSRGRVLFLSRLSQAGRWLRTQDCWPRSHWKAWRWWWESRDQGTPGRHGDGVYTWTRARHP